MSGAPIISRLHGGLGNQMFQYAAGRAVALRTGRDLALDLRYFDEDVPFDFGLPNFSARFRVATPEELPPSKKVSPLGYGIWRGLRLQPRLVREKGLGFNPGVLTLRDTVYLHGYWQSEKYFEDCAQQIRTELTVSTPPSTANAEVLEHIQTTPAVSLHVRRGDYASNPAITAAHGLCSPDYYARAIEHIAGRMAEKPVVFVFSDDPDWSETNLRFPFETRIVRGNSSQTSFEDLRLMSACRHHIIANSSFSWWGAWLNPSTDKIVAAPKDWFADPRMKNDDIQCADWHVF
jgi:hypothetical protein